MAREFVNIAARVAADDKNGALLAVWDVTSLFSKITTTRWSGRGIADRSVALADGDADGVGCGAAATGGVAGVDGEAEGARLPHAAAPAAPAIAMTARVQIRTCLATCTPLLVSIPRLDRPMSRR
jgi:hypothetical protein